jgi:O-antigen ligase
MTDVGPVSIRLRQKSTTEGVTPFREPLGGAMVLLLLWLLFELGRPPQSLAVPMLLAIATFVLWLRRKDKRWSKQHSLFVAFLALAVISVPLAANNYEAFLKTYGLVVTLLPICIPMPSVLTSARRIRAWGYTFVAGSVYVGVWALFHEGVGPAGSGGAQDENYVSAIMCMAIPFAYFSIFSEARRWVRLMLTCALVIFAGAVVVSMSRGGFLGLCAVILYCIARSPRKLLGFSMVAVIVLAMMLFAGSGYWTEMNTIADTSEATADMRLEIWQIGLRMWRGNPVLGVGPGNFRAQVGDYQSQEQFEKFGRSLQGSIVAHSLPVELVAELGTVGLVIVVALLWGTWRGLRRLQRNIPRPGRGTVPDARWPLRCDGDAVIGALVGCLVTGVFLSLLYFSYMWILIALGNAIMQVFRARPAEQLPPIAKRVSATPGVR